MARKPRDVIVKVKGDADFKSAAADARRDFDKIKRRADNAADGIRGKFRNAARSITDSFKTSARDIPRSFDGVRSKIKGKLDGIGSSIRSALKFGAIGGIAGLAGLTGAALKFGQSFETMRNIIIRGTGASGEALTKFTESAKRVLGTVPDAGDIVASTLADVNTFFGLTGKSLETATKTFLDFARVADVETGVAIDKLDGIMTQFRLGVDQTDETLGDLVRIAQATGAPMEKLLTQMQEFGPVFSNANFSAEETAAIFGQLAQAGISVSRVTPALNKFFRTAAEGGREPREELAKMVDALASAKSETEALALATDAFGAEGAQRMVSAIRSGNFDLREFNGLLGDGAGVVAEQAKAIETLTDKWNRFKNQGLVALEPLLTPLFDRIGTGLDNLGPKFQEFGPKIVETLQPIVDAVADIAPEVGRLAVQMAPIIAQIVTAALPLVRLAGNLATKFGEADPAIQKTVISFGLLSLAAGPVVSRVVRLAGSVSGLVRSAARLGPGLAKVGSGLAKVGPATGRAAASFARLSGAAARAGAAVVRAGVRMAASAARATGRVVASIALQVGRWVVLGAQALAQAARVAAAWLISLGPIALIGVAVVALVALVVTHWDTISSTVTAGAEKIRGALSAVVDWVRENWPLLLAVLTGPFGVAALLIVKNWDRIKAGAAAVRDFVVERFESIKAGIQSRIDGIVAAVKGLPGRIKSAAAGAWDSLLESLKNVLRKIKALIDKVSITVPSLDIPGIGTVGGQKISLSAALPRLATGTVARQEMAAIIGDNRNARHDPEIVSPLSLMIQAFTKALAAGGRSSPFIGEATIVVPEGADVFAELQRTEALHR